jgi:hypothetical protein
MKKTHATGSNSTAPSTAPGADTSAGLIRPEDLRHITEEAEMAKLREIMEREKRRDAEQKELHNAFLNQHIHPDAKKRFTDRVRQAAQRGEHEIQVVRFSSDFCSDGGRAINNFDSNWPSTLTGFAKEVYDVYEQQLRPLGYKMRAQILNYPGGVPGDVGIFLSW